jgi:hypothetical protein
MAAVTRAASVLTQCDDAEQQIIHVVALVYRHAVAFDAVCVKQAVL